MKYTVFLVSAFLNCTFGIDTVPDLNVTKYLGRWYQMYSDPTVIATFERDAVCVIADYRLRKDGKVGILNSERLHTPTGEGKNITGYAYIPDPKEPGKLKVHLEGAPVDAPYWVVKLGPPTFSAEGLYQYSVVTDGLQITLFVLTRDVDTFKRQFDEEVQSWLAENDFTRFYNKPVATLQDKECIYVAERPSPCQRVEEMIGYE